MEGLSASLLIRICSEWPGRGQLGLSSCPLALSCGPPTRQFSIVSIFYHEPCKTKRKAKQPHPEVPDEEEQPKPMASPMEGCRSHLTPHLSGASWRPWPRSGPRHPAAAVGGSAGALTWSSVLQQQKVTPTGNRMLFWEPKPTMGEVWNVVDCPCTHWLWFRSFRNHKLSEKESQEGYKSSLGPQHRSLRSRNQGWKLNYGRICAFLVYCDCPELSTQFTT